VRSLAVGAAAADVPTFLRAAGDEDYEVATVALSALAKLGVPADAVAQLAPLLDSGNPYVRLSAANAILTLERGAEESAG
jgi:HEAT repeat protein